MQEIKNFIAKKLAGFVAPYLQTGKSADAVVLEADATHGRQVINKSHYSPMSAEALLSSQQAAQLLKLSFQRNVSDFVVSQDGKPSYALDSSDEGRNLSTKNMFGMDGIANAVIYTFFAKHGFIGWQLCSMLAQHWLINRACRIPNEDALAPGWVLDWQKADGGEEESEEKEKKAELLKSCVEIGNKKFKLTEKALRFGINRSIYGQALAYFIIEGDDPSTPLNIDGIKPGSFKGISIVEPYWAFPDWKTDSMQPGSLSFYRPDYYTIGGQRIHRSRLVVKPFVEVPDVLKPSYYFGGIPLTQMIYERVYAAEKTANEVPELALTKRMLVVDANMADFVANPDVMAQKMNLLAKFRNNNGVFFKDRPDQVSQVDTNLSDLDANVWTQYQLVASCASMPADRLLCTSPKGFQSTGEYEQRTYAQTLQSSYQEFCFREFLEKANAIIMKSELGVSAPVVLNFNPIDTPTEAEKAQTLLTKASRDAALVNAGIISPEEARGALIADKESGYGDIRAETPEMGDLAQLQGLLGQQEQEPQPGLDAAFDDRWITIHPPHGNKDDKGVPLKIDDNGEIKAGAGGKFTGKKIVEIKKKPAISGNSGEKKEEKAKTSSEPQKAAKKEPKSKAAMKGYMEAKNKPIDSNYSYSSTLGKKIEMARKFNEAVSSLQGTIKEEIEANKTDAEDFIKSVGSQDLDAELSDIKEEENELNMNREELNDMVVEVNKAGARVTVSLFNKEMSAEEKQSLEKEYQDKRKEYADLRNAYMGKVSDIQKRKENIHRKYAEKVSDYLKKNGSTKFNVNVTKTTLPKITKALQETLAGCLSDEWNTGASLEIRKTSRRANFADNGVIRGTNEISTMIHEYAHYLEENNPAMLANSIAFLEYRTKGENAKSLRSITGIGYRANEKAKPDNFFSPYCGKLYTSGNFGVVHATASEIMSMGMEELFTNPVGFAKKDPEYFNFVIANMRGLL